MEMAKRAGLPQSHGGVRIKPFRAEREPGQFGVRAREARQVWHEFLVYGEGHVIRMTLDTLYLVRYLRARLRIGMDAAPDPRARPAGRNIFENELSIQESLLARDTAQGLVEHKSESLFPAGL